MFDDSSMNEGEIFDSSPVWPASADLMACLSGLFVLLFVSVLVFQLDLLTRLDDEKDKLAQEQKARAAENARLKALEAALAGPLAKGRITLDGAKIGIQGNLLFAPASPDLSEEGAGLILDLALPLATYAEQTHMLLMVSGFTDNLPVMPGGRYVDNWELSQARAMTVTRVLMSAGFPRGRLLAAGFGENYPVASNETEEGRSLNRRVEIAPVPVPRALAAREKKKEVGSPLGSPVEKGSKEDAEKRDEAASASSNSKEQTIEDPSVTTCKNPPCEEMPSGDALKNESKDSVVAQKAFQDAMNIAKKKQDANKKESVEVRADAGGNP
ncbi:MAG: OmpA family protein [Deltaproteobacteria bacterium]|nr:OmpA family protein [Deltaproteobacteria bacterium]